MRWPRYELGIDEPSAIIGDPEINETHFAYAAYLLLLGSAEATLFYLQAPEKYNAMLQQFPHAILKELGLE